eukprot:766752-Hanusia_phi.AAC.12
MRARAATVTPCLLPFLHNHLPVLLQRAVGVVLEDDIQSGILRPELVLDVDCGKGFNQPGSEGQVSWGNLGLPGLGGVEPLP